MSKSNLFLTLILFLASSTALSLPGEVICNQPLVLDEIKVSSEVYISGDVETEVADDCFAEESGTITKVIWWGGNMDGGPNDPEVISFNLRFYTDNECRPDELIAELLDQSPLITYIDDGPWGYPTYQYELDTDIHVEPGIFWFSGQGGHDGGYPPKVGRGGDGGKFSGREDCEAVFRGDCFGWPVWTPVSNVIDQSWMASQQFEFVPDGTASASMDWSFVKAAYR